MTDQTQSPKNALGQPVKRRSLFKPWLLFSPCHVGWRADTHHRVSLAPAQRTATKGERVAVGDERTCPLARARSCQPAINLSSSSTLQVSQRPTRSLHTSGCIRRLAIIARVHSMSMP